MFTGSDVRDWFIMVLVAGMWIASTVFIFLHPEPPNFVTWSGLCTTMAGIYHWLTIHDSKVPDVNRG